MQTPEQVRQQNKVKQAQDNLTAITQDRRKHQSRCGACPITGITLELFCDDGYALLLREQGAKTALRKAKESAKLIRMAQMEMPL